MLSFSLCPKLLDPNLTRYSKHWPDFRRTTYVLKSGGCSPESGPWFRPALGSREMKWRRKKKKPNQKQDEPLWLFKVIQSQGKIKGQVVFHFYSQGFIVPACCTSPEARCWMQVIKSRTGKLCWRNPVHQRWKPVQSRYFSEWGLLCFLWKGWLHFPSCVCDTAVTQVTGSGRGRVKTASPLCRALTLEPLNLAESLTSQTWERRPSALKGPLMRHLREEERMKRARRLFSSMLSPDQQRTRFRGARLKPRTALISMI